MRRFFSKRITRSRWGNAFVLVFLLTIGAFAVIPLLFTINNAFKPLDEFFLFPPKLFVRNPTLDNFADLAALLASSWVPFSRYLFNSLLVVLLGTGGHVLVVSMAAYALARHRFPGSRLLFSVIILSLMVAREVTQAPNFLIMSSLRLIDTYWAMILPAVIYPLGLFLMKQFMEGIPEAVLESARVTGASEYQILWRIVMPMVKPAWLTLILFDFQYVWGELSIINPFVLKEAIKTLPYVMTHIARAQAQGSVTRIYALEGVSAAVYCILLLAPLVVFLVTQSSIIETMSASGLKE